MDSNVLNAYADVILCYLLSLLENFKQMNIFPIFVKLPESYSFVVGVYIATSSRGMLSALHFIIAPQPTCILPCDNIPDVVLLSGV